MMINEYCQGEVGVGYRRACQSGGGGQADSGIRVEGQASEKAARKLAQVAVRGLECRVQRSAEGVRLRRCQGTGQVFGEVGYKVDLHGAVVEPFAGLSYDEVSTQKAAETGGVAALAVAGQTREVISSRLGLRASVDLDPHVSLHSSVAWRHAGDDVDGTARVAFEGTGQGFTVSGQPIAQDAAEITAGIAGKLGAHGRVDVSYSGQIASHWQDNAVKLLAAWDF